MDNKDYFMKLLENVEPEDYVEFMARHDRIEGVIKALQDSPDSTMSCMKRMMQYRDLRTKQAWVSELLHHIKTHHDPELENINPDFLKDDLVRIDKSRRGIHNDTLSSFCNFINSQKKAGNSRIYRGNLMDPLKEPDHYGDHRVRQEMTDGILSILYDIEEMNLKDIFLDRMNQEYGSSSVESLRELSKNLRSQSRSYGAREPLKEDD